MISLIFFSAIRGARKFGIQDISWSGRMKAWLEMMNYDFRIRAENFKIRIGIVYLRILVWLGRVPSLEEIRSVIEKEQKRYDYFNQFSNIPNNIDILNTDLSKDIEQFNKNILNICTCIYISFQVKSSVKHQPLQEQRDKSILCILFFKE